MHDTNKIFAMLGASCLLLGLTPALALAQTKSHANRATRTNHRTTLRHGTAVKKNASTKKIQAVTVTAQNFSFAPGVLNVKRGQKVRLTFKNLGGMHDLRIDELRVASKKIAGGKQQIVEFTPMKKGTFDYYCSVGRHRAMGMIGKITVN